MKFEGGCLASNHYLASAKSSPRFDEKKAEEEWWWVMCNSLNLLKTFPHSQWEFRTRRGKKGRSWCDHCKKPGHVRDKCWKLHGKLADRKSPRPETDHHGSHAYAGEGSLSSVESSPSSWKHFRKFWPRQIISLPSTHQWHTKVKFMVYLCVQQSRFGWLSLEHQIIWLEMCHYSKITAKSEENILIKIVDGYVSKKWLDMAP